MTLRVVAVVPSDAATLADFRRLLDAYNADLPADLALIDHAGEMRELLQRYPPSEAALLVAYAGDRAIGCVIVRDVDDRTSEVKRLYVDPAARGLGAGRALVQRAIDWARGRARKRIVLDTHRDRLKAAFALYCSLGFIPCASYAEPEYECPTFMELQLE